MTDYTPDPQALRALLDAPKIAATCPPDLDSHRWTASKIYGVEYDEVTPDQRAAIKLACFGSSPTERLPNPHREVVSSTLYREGDRVMVQWDFGGDIRGPYVVKHIDGVARLVTVDEMRQRQVTSVPFDRGAWRDLLADRALSRAHAVFIVEPVEDSTLDALADQLRTRLGFIQGRRFDSAVVDEIYEALREPLAEGLDQDVEPGTDLLTLRVPLSWKGVKAFDFDYAAMEQLVAERLHVGVDFMQGRASGSLIVTDRSLDSWYETVRKVAPNPRGTRAPKRKRPRRIARKLAQRGGFAKYPTASQALLRKCRS